MVSRFITTIANTPHTADIMTNTVTNGSASPDPYNANNFVKDWTLKKGMVLLPFPYSCCRNLILTVFRHSRQCRS